MLMWVMSDRAIPRSYRTMEGFGVHTFRLVNAKGETSLVKFHWKPVAGVHSLVWEEAQKLGGIDPDFHRRDLWDAIETGPSRSGSSGVQVFPDTEDADVRGHRPARPDQDRARGAGAGAAHRPAHARPQPDQLLRRDRAGRLLHASTWCRGIDFTDDPLLQARNFSYLDTQLTRLGGPNFDQLPINRPHAPVNDNLRDGMHQTLVHTGITPYLPNTLDADQPLRSTAGEGGFVTVPTVVEGAKVRESPVSFQDHYSQAALFWNSMTDVEKVHIIAAFSFELSHVFEQSVKERMLEVLANVDSVLCRHVAEDLGLPVPTGNPPTEVESSPALSQIVTVPGPITGRVIGVVTAPGADLAGVSALRKAAVAQGAVVRVIAPTGGFVSSGRTKLVVDRALPGTRSIEYDAVVVAGGTAGLHDIKLSVLLDEMFRHCKAIGAWGDGETVLLDANIDVKAPGVLLGDKASVTFAKDLFKAMGLHRAWARAELVMAS